MLFLDEGEQIGEPRHSGTRAEPVIGPRFARTRWRGPGIQQRALLWIPGSPAQGRARPGMTAFIML
jgi:hypothetical protein